MRSFRETVAIRALRGDSFRESVANGPAEREGTCPGVGANSSVREGLRAGVLVGTPARVLSVVRDGVGGSGGRPPTEGGYGVRLQVTVGAGLLLLFQVARNPKLVDPLGGITAL